MNNITRLQKEKILNRLANNNYVKEKDILNLKISDLKKIYEKDKISIKDIETIWLLQEAIETGNVLHFFRDN